VILKSKRRSDANNNEIAVASIRSEGNQKARERERERENEKDGKEEPEVEQSTVQVGQGVVFYFDVTGRACKRKGKRSTTTTFFFLFIIFTLSFSRSVIG
jgi:hypothetical protein